MTKLQNRTIPPQRSGKNGLSLRHETQRTAPPVCRSQPPGRSLADRTCAGNGAPPQDAPAERRGARRRAPAGAGRVGAPLRHAGGAMRAARLRIRRRHRHRHARNAARRRIAPLHRNDGADPPAAHPALEDRPPDGRKCRTGRLGTPTLRRTPPTVRSLFRQLHLDGQRAPIRTSVA